MGPLADTLYITMRDKVWVRGDGSRYKDLNEIYVRGHAYPYELETETINLVWDYMTTVSRNLYVLQGEFQSMARPATKYKGNIYVKNDISIEFASVGILRNTWVWRLHEPEDYP